MPDHPPSNPAAPPHPPPAALALYTKVLAAESLREAGHSLVSSMVVDFGFSHASIGLHEGGRTRLLAGSSGSEAVPGAAASQHEVAAAEHDTSERGTDVREELEAILELLKSPV